jgi:hypothetical protein
MKTKILLGISFLFYFAETALSCPVWRVGKMYIVDEHGKPIPDAKVIRYISLEDSFWMKKNRYNYLDTLDSNAYVFWRGGGLGWRTDLDKLPNKYLRIQAPGYADVIIKEMTFKSKRYDEPLTKVYIHMYAKSYLRKGDLFTLINQYISEEEITVEDSMHLRIENYNQSLRSENAVEFALRTSVALVKTYPNPVLDKLNIEINSVIIKPYKVTLTDMQGRTINEMSIDNSRSILDMQWEAKGMYFIQVYDPEGVLLYSLKFLKT